MKLTKIMRTTLLAPVFIAFTLMASDAMAEAKCLNKKQTRKAVQAGEAVQLSAVRGEVTGEIVKAKLCKKGEKYHYQITVLSKEGAVKKIKVDATR